MVNNKYTIVFTGNAKTVILDGQKEGNQMVFRVTCDGACQNIKIFLVVDSGDADLFAQEHSIPVITGNKCNECSSFCSSRKGTGNTEVCDISTASNRFYVMIYAYSAYGNGTLTATNALSIGQTGKYKYN